MSNDASLAHEREVMIEHLEELGYVRSESVAAALDAIPREAFLEGPLRSYAYRDSPLPIGGDQTISAPHMVAIMCEALELRPGHRVLEVGGGSGYHAAVVAQLVAPGPVTSIEFDARLAARAQETVRRLGIRNLTIREGDGAHGAPDQAPFDRIYLACAAPAFPAPLLEQLKPDGFILAPIGGRSAELIKRQRTNAHWRDEDLGACAFVPLRGRYGARSAFDT